MTNHAPFLRRTEVEKLHPVCDRTRAKAEQSGLFPARVRLAEKTFGWLRSDVEAWLADPNQWQQKHTAERAVS